MIHPTNADPAAAAVKDSTTNSEAIGSFAYDASAIRSAFANAEPKIRKGDLCKLAQCSFPTLANIFAGTRNVRIDTLTTICNALGMSTIPWVNPGARAIEMVHSPSASTSVQINGGELDGCQVVLIGPIPKYLYQPGYSTRQLYRYDLCLECFAYHSDVVPDACPADANPFDLGMVVHPAKPPMTPPE